MHVDRFRACRLSGVDDQQDIMRAGDLADTADIRHISRQIGRVGADDRLGVPLDQTFKVSVVNIAPTVGGDKIEFDSLFALQTV